MVIYSHSFICSSSHLLQVGGSPNPSSTLPSLGNQKTVTSCDLLDVIQEVVVGLEGRKAYHSMCTNPKWVGWRMRVHMTWRLFQLYMASSGVGVDDSFVEVDDFSFTLSNCLTESEKWPLLTLGFVVPDFSIGQFHF